jgi:probable phosphoglycerate mutase
MPDPTAVVTLIRHGQTHANVEGIWHGSTDTPLTACGERQAERTALHVSRTRPDLAAVYTSPLERARLTGAPLAARLGLDPQIQDDLREYDLGAWEGKSYRELTSELKLFERMQREPDWEPGGGESPRAVAMRLSGAIRALAERHPGERIAIVTHGGALTLALGWLLDRDVSTWRRVVSNASVSDLVFTPEPVMRGFDQVAHLGNVT